MEPEKIKLLMRLWRDDLQHVVLPSKPTPGYEFVAPPDVVKDGWSRPGYVVQPRQPRVSWNYALRVWRHLRDWGWSGAEIGGVWGVTRTRVYQILQGQ